MNEISNITILKGVGEKKEKDLNSMGIYTLWDLMNYYPRDYDGFSEIATTKDLDEYFEKDTPILLNLVIKTDPVLRYVKKLKILNVIAQDEDGSVELTWFNQQYLKAQLYPGKHIIVRGTVKKKGVSYHISQAKIIKSEEYERMRNTLQPVYKLSKNITGKYLSGLMKQIIDEIPNLEDHFEDELKPGGKLSELSFPSLWEAICNMHFPKDRNSLIKSRERVVFDEFFFFILNIRLLKEKGIRNPNDFVMKKSLGVDQILKNLPYKLTNAQMRTYEEIMEDFAGPYSANRLIQGDVGSGKTIIAVLSMITAAENGHQAAIMAPTEVLARQHYDGFVELINENHLDMKPIILTGSMTEKEKREAREKIASKEADIIIGTHSLIQEKVEFSDLALVVTDEQHRFGVKQRETFAQKSGKIPHILVMSATPIPRTLAIIIYGDLDLSVIDELPASRLPIKNCVVGPNYRPKSYEFITKQVQEGRQALVVCPMVEESEELDAENVIDYTKRLKEALPKNFCIEYLHGKMKPKEKNDIMERFSKGIIQVLVSTTVIEVGINVPNTTVMMVENSERFGLAQLHQLRGRVGRGSHQSYCIFMCGNNSEKIRKRLDILNHSNDGFKIAEEDLKQRGPGDLFGFRQSGDMNFKIGDIFTDAPLLKLASEHVDWVLSGLESDEELNPLLLKRLQIYRQAKEGSVNL